MGTGTALRLIGRPGGGSGVVSRDRERKADRRTEVADLHDELTARRAEAIDLVDGLAPLISFLVAGAMALGPRHHQAAITAQERLARFRRQQEGIR